MRDPETIDRKAALLAAAVSLGLHLLLVLWLPRSFQKVVALSAQPVQFSATPLKIAEERLPPTLRYAETNPAANQAIPKQAAFVSARNQTAAQPVPEKVPTRSALPKSAGTSDQIRLAQGKPRSIAQSEASPSPQPSISMLPASSQGESAPAGQQGGSAPGPKAAPPAVAQTPPAPPAAANPDRPKAFLPPSGTYGLMLKNNVGVSRAGSLAIDARFSNYGDYMQRMMEAIQSAWWNIIERSRFETVERGSVRLRFVLHRDGTVTGAEILAASVPRIMALACKDAVMAPAPYDLWRADMVALYGEADTVTITFNYN